MEIVRFGKALFRKLHTLEIPTPSILFVAAVLGSVSNAIAFTKAHTVLGSDATAPSYYLVIIPPTTQKQVPLALPVIPPEQTAP